MTTRSAKKPAEKPLQVARFTARYVAQLAPFVDRRLVEAYPGLQIEPHPDGGVWLTATDGATLAQVWDRDGQTTAPLVLTVPPEFVSACEAPHGRRLLDANLRSWRPTPPRWMWPGQVNVTWDGFADSDMRLTTVEVAEPAPGDDGGNHTGLYHASKHGAVPIPWPLVDWRPLFEAFTPAPVTELALSVRFLARLRRFGGDYSDVRLTFSGETGMLLATFPGQWNARVAIMPRHAVPAAASPLEKLLDDIDETQDADALL